MKNTKNHKNINNALLGLFIALTTAAAPVFGTVPELINFQGKLTNSAGNPVTAVVPMVFRLYTAPGSATPVWTESQDVTPDAYGIYSVLLGSAAPFSNFSISFSTAYWLGVSVGTDGEMLPRYRLVSSAYSLYSINSSTAAWAGGADWPTITNKPNLTIQGNNFNDINQLVQLGGAGVGGFAKLPPLDGSLLTGIATAFLADGSVTTVKLANNAVTDAKVSLSTSAISSGKFDDGRVAISTQAVSGGIHNIAGRFVQLGADGFLPVLNGSNLTSLTKAQVGLGSADNTSDAAKPVSTLQQTALNLKANLAGATFTGAIAATNLSGSNTGDETAVTIKSALGAATASADGYLTSADWAAFNGKLAPGGNGSLLTGMTAGQVGLGSVDNTSDAAKPVSVLQQSALNLKANLAGATFTGAISATNLSGSNAGDETAATIKTKLGAATASTDGYLTSVNWATFNSKLSPTGSGSSLTGLTKAQVGLGSVDDTSDAAKPVSTAQQTALDLKANLASPAFTGTVTGITSAMVGLGSVNNTADAGKPVSSFQQAALDLKANLTGATFTGAITAPNLSGSNTGDQLNGVYTTGTYANPAWITSLATSKIDLSTVTAAITPMQIALTTAVYTSGDQTIGGIKTFSSTIGGDISGNAVTATSAVSAGKATNIAGGAAGQLPYQSGADSTALLAAGTQGQVLQSNGGAPPIWVTPAVAGDVVKAGTQTLTGLNTFTSTITAKGLANASQLVVLGGGATTIAADGSGVVLMSLTGAGNVIGTIAGCTSGAVGQGQIVTFVIGTWAGGGSISFTDNVSFAAGADDTMLLNAAAGDWTPIADVTSLGSTMTLLCTTIKTAVTLIPVKLWVEIGRSKSNT